MLLKLASGVLFAFSLGFIGLFVATMTGLYKSSYPGWQFLHSEPRFWTGAQLLFKAALWLCLYIFASRKLEEASRSAKQNRPSGDHNSVRVLTPLIMASLAIFCGCTQHGMKLTRGGGDAGQFILQQAVTRGARDVTTNNLTNIGGRWRYSEDQYGVVLRLPRDRFEEVELFLRQAFGPPAQEPTDTTDGGKLGWYAASTIGVGLQFGYDREHTQVIVLSPQPTSEILKRIPEALEQRR